MRSRLPAESAEPDGDPSDVLRAYDSDERRHTQLVTPGTSVSWDSPVLRLIGPDPEPWSNGIMFSDLIQEDADAVIQREIAFFQERGHDFEWKQFGHDRPHDLAERLAAAGFVPEPQETLVAFDVSWPFDTPSTPSLPIDVRFERLDDPDTFGVIARIKGDVYSDPTHADWLVKSLQDEKRAAPDALSVHVAFVDDEPAAAGWARFPEGSRFASLWGGATRADRRRQGLYTTLVARRLTEARERGYRWLTVDCSRQSLPILERRGFRRLTSTTPWIWRTRPDASMAGKV